MSVAELQRQVAALESRNASLLAKADDAENEVAFHKKRFDTAVSKATAEKEEEIAQSQQRSNTAPRHSTTAQHSTAAASHPLLSLCGWLVVMWCVVWWCVCVVLRWWVRMKAAFAEVSEKRKEAFTQLKESRTHNASHRITPHHTAHAHASLT